MGVRWDEEPRREDYAECRCNQNTDYEEILGFVCGGCEEYGAARDDWHRKVDALTEQDDPEVRTW
jgi:hypothetical protein